MSPDGSKVVVREGGRVRTYASSGRLLEELVLDAYPVGWADAGPVLMSRGLESSLFVMEEGIPRLVWRGAGLSDARWNGDAALLIAGNRLLQVEADGTTTDLEHAATAADALPDGTRLFADADSTSSRLLLQSASASPIQQSQIRGGITSVAAAADVPRAVLEQRSSVYWAHHVALDPVGKRVLSNADMALANDVFALGFLTENADLMAFKTGSAAALMTIDMNVTEYVRVSPDGTRLAFADPKGRVHIAPVGPPLTATSGDGAGIGLELVGWVDDERLLVADREQAASVLHVADGRLDPLGHQVWIALPAGVEDLVMATHKDRLFWLDVTTRDSWPILTVDGNLDGLDLSMDGTQLIYSVSQEQRRLWLAEFERE